MLVFSSVFFKEKKSDNGKILTSEQLLNKMQHYLVLHPASGLKTNEVRNKLGK